MEHVARQVRQKIFVQLPDWSARREFVGEGGQRMRGGNECGLNMRSNNMNTNLGALATSHKMYRVRVYYSSARMLAAETRCLG